MDSRRFRFAPFDFDAATLELRREGVLVRLQTQPAQLLVFLLERSGQVVSRDALRAAVWGDKTFVDFENGLNFCVSQLRSALQDDSSQPRYIRTVPKSGYQFVAPVSRISPPSPESPQPDGNQARTAIPLLVRIAMLAAGLIAIAAIVLLSLRSRPFHIAAQSQVQAPILTVSRFDNETGDPALSIFANNLTDNVVQQLTIQANGAYRVIGNAQILRLPREHRDLPSIASSLQASYAVLGQVQTNGTQIRVLAHLIRLSDQTHIWVVREDLPQTDSLSQQSAAAQKIAADFSARMAADPDRASSFPSATK